MKYFIITYGCEANKADSERIARHLEMDGHKKASNEKGAKLIVINACSVRQSAIDRVREKINKYKKLKKKIILSGCVLEKDKKKFGEKVGEIWHPDEYFDLKPLYSDSSIAYVPITSGCDNFCTYCAVPYTRGREKSRPAKDIIKEVGNLAKNKYKEIWLLGQNVNSYKSGKINFPKLLLHLNTIVDKCNAKCCLRFTSPHPKDFSDELIKAIASCNKVTKYINLPVQSGDNEILKKMNRNYTREHYIKLVKKIRRVIPDIKISTDVIVGFPGETKKQFQNTVELFEKIRFDKAYVARYSPRPGTVSAEKMKDSVSPKEKKKRWDIINKIANSKKKIIVVLGPTASGKSDLAVDIALKFGNMEIISADSRQVYKGMDIGSGKITKKEMRGIKHHLLDVISPKKIFSAGDFKKLGEKAINEILEKKKVPIVCGGTGFYIHALLEGLGTAGIKPDWNLRKKLEKKSIDELFKMLKKLNKERASNIDAKNKRRLIRAIEIQYGEVRPPNIERYDVLYLGIKKKHKNLKELIHKRLLRRIKQGMIVEVKRLHNPAERGKKGVSWKRLDGLGLEYRFVSRYLRGLTTKEEMIEQLNTAIVQYSKRQMTWFKKHAPETKWVKNGKKAHETVKKFLKE
ncbi:tRNA (adenosine(37)-N6)-dimethylallyltransferase MiaA [Patescibacteria group bacterium]|nr:tRNA (adenosine(37)-N6)-dimethylallyltransferase MiaA [Patescibacteria group bacterium]